MNERDVERGDRANGSKNSVINSHQQERADCRKSPRDENRAEVYLRRCFLSSMSVGESIRSSCLGKCHLYYTIGAIVVNSCHCLDTRIWFSFIMSVHEDDSCFDHYLCLRIMSTVFLSNFYEFLRISTNFLRQQSPLLKILTRKDKKPFLGM